MRDKNIFIYESATLTPRKKKYLKIYLWFVKFIFVHFISIIYIHFRKVHEYKFYLPQMNFFKYLFLSVIIGSATCTEKRTLENVFVCTRHIKFIHENKLHIWQVNFQVFPLSASVPLYMLCQIFLIVSTSDKRLNLTVKLRTFKELTKKKSGIKRRSLCGDTRALPTLLIVFSHLLTIGAACNDWCCSTATMTKS